MAQRPEALCAARNVRRPSGHGRSDVNATCRASSARRRKHVSHVSRKPTLNSPSLWRFHRVLARHLQQRGFGSGSFIALKILSEGLYPALTFVLLAYWQAVEDAFEEWARGR